MYIFIGLLLVILALAIGSLFLAHHSMPTVTGTETSIINQAQGDGAMMYFGVAMLLLMLDAALMLIGFLTWLFGPY